DVLVQHMREVVHGASANQGDRLEHLLRSDLVQCAGLVVRAPAGNDRRRLRRRRHSDDQVVSNDGYSVSPPSTNSVWPVMYAAASESRNDVTAAISEASPARRIGMWDSTACRFTGSSIHDRLIGVTVAPGPMPL